MENWPDKDDHYVLAGRVWAAGLYSDAELLEKTYRELTEGIHSDSYQENLLNSYIEISKRLESKIR